MNFIKEISNSDKSTEEVVDNFLKQIGAKRISKEEFVYKNKKVFIDYHPFDHSDDIIIHEDVIDKYDNFLLVKTGASRTRIPGWCSKEQLKSTQRRDIYRNGKFYYLVNDTNIKDLSVFQILDDKKLKTEFIINKQKADTLAGKEYIDSILTGLHYFAKQAGIFFKDINQKDECILGDKKIKIYTRDIMSDEDMPIPNNYYKNHPEIDLYICCKIKAGNYWYVGYTTKEVVKGTRIVKLIGSDSDGESPDVRNIFAEQYKPISDLIKIYEEEKEEEKIIPQSYVPLHVHSEFSIGDGFGTINYLAETLHKKGFKGAALTDHGTMGGVWYFQKAMLERGLKPAIGCEFYVKIPEIEKRLHIVLIAKTKEGWQNLIKLQSIAVREHFYYKPVIQIEEILENSNGIIASTACMSGIIPSLLFDGQFELAEKYLIKLKKAFKDDLYGEIMLHTIHGNQEAMENLYNLCGKHNIKCIFTTDSHYPNAEDIKYHEAIKAIGRKTKYGEAGFEDDCFYLMTDDEIEKRINSDEKTKWLNPIMNEMKANTNEILDKIDFLIEPPDEIDTLPKLFGSQEERKIKLKELCLKGLEKNTPYKYEGKIKEQLDLELNRVFEKNYENYFLIVYYLIKHAKENGTFCGPGRGSVGASLLAYSLNITECDPIKFNLLFDRFMSEIRRDMPDVDMDFQDSKRYEVFDYLKNQYGKNNCAKVSTYSRFHPKGILRDIGRIFSIPIREIEKICSLVIERSGGDARASFSLYDTFEEYQEAKEFKIKYPDAVDVAIKLEGHIRHKGIHAAAMVVTEKDINNYVPIGKLNGEIVTEWEKQLVEDMKLIKFDILGLKTLSVLSDCIKDSGVNPPSTFDDKKVYEKVFKEGKTLGVFQAETVGMSKLIKQLKTSDFKTLYHATTLFRPSALHSGQTMMYANRKLGKEDVKYEHPLLEELTKDTLGTIMFQEQIMQIMNRIGGMSWATAEMARKTITKSKGKKAFEELRVEFVKNANRLHDMPIKEAEKLYDVVSTFGCLTGDTKIYRASSNQHSGKKLTIKEAFKYQNSDNFKHRGLKILAMSADGYVRPHKIKAIHETGVKSVFYIRTSGGKTIKASEKHRFFVNGDWLTVKQIVIGDLIRVSDLKLAKKVYSDGRGSGNHKTCPKFRKGEGKTNDEKRRKKELMDIYHGCQICSSKKFVELHHKDKDHSNNSKENTMLLCRKHHKEYENANLARFQKGYYTHWEKVEEIKYSSNRQTYDIEMEEAPRNFIANNFVSHNSYGFNMAHAIEYSIISYWCAFYKIHHPLAFYKAILKYETDAVKISSYLDDAKRNGIEIEYPDINLSGVQYEIKNKKIYSGFDSIKGIGERTAQKIIKSQPYESFEDFLKRSGISKSILSGLIVADCFRDFKINKKVCYNKDIKEVQNYYSDEKDFTDIEYAELIMGRTTLKPKLDLINTYNFGDMDFINISDLGEEYGGQLGCVRGVVTDVINKDKLILQGIRKHIHNFENHMFYLNINDGTGNLAIQINPWTYDKYKDIVRDLVGKPIVVYGKFAKSGQKVYAELIEIPQETNDITELYKSLKTKKNIIISSTPAVSKKENSYYRLKISDGAEGLCFKPPQILYAGLEVEYQVRQKPFMDVKII